MTKCHKCDRLYEAIIALLDENIRYFEYKEYYRDKPIENLWSEARRKAYAENRINAFRTRKDFIKRFYEED